MREPIYRFKRDKEIGRMDKIVCLAFLEEVELPTEELWNILNSLSQNGTKKLSAFNAITNLLKGEK